MPGVKDGERELSDVGSGLLARLWQPGHTPGRLDLAVELVMVVCQHLGPRRVHLVVDGAYAGKALRSLPKQVTVTTRLRADARLYRLPRPRRPGIRGRPRTKGDRLPELTLLAGKAMTWVEQHRRRGRIGQVRLDRLGLPTHGHDLLSHLPAQERAAGHSSPAGSARTRPPVAGR
jgi:hypothetical protein